MRRRSALKEIGGVAFGSVPAGCTGGEAGMLGLRVSDQPVATEVEVIFGTVAG